MAIAMNETLRVATPRSHATELTRNGVARYSVILWPSESRHTPAPPHAPRRRLVVLVVRRRVEREIAKFSLWILCTRMYLLIVVVCPKRTLLGPSCRTATTS